MPPLQRVIGIPVRDDPKGEYDRTLRYFVGPPWPVLPLPPGKISLGSGSQRNCILRIWYIHRRINHRLLRWVEARQWQGSTGADDGNINHDIGQNSPTAAAVPYLFSPALGRPADRPAVGCLRGQDELRYGTGPAVTDMCCWWWWCSWQHVTSGCCGWGRPSTTISSLPARCRAGAARYNWDCNIHTHHPDTVAVWVSARSPSGLGRDHYFVPVAASSIAISVSVCLSVYVSVCLHISKISCPNFTKFSPHVIWGRDSGPFLTAMQSIRYVFPVLWMTSCFHMMERMGQNQRRWLSFVQFARWRSLPSPTAHLVVAKKVDATIVKQSSSRRQLYCYLITLAVLPNHEALLINTVQLFSRWLRHPTALPAQLFGLNFSIVKCNRNYWHQQDDILCLLSRWMRFRYDFNLNDESAIVHEIITQIKT